MSESTDPETPEPPAVEHGAAGQRVLGKDRGRFTVPEDFDAPLPDDLLDEFER